MARQAIDNLLVNKEGLMYCQPCVSPVWDTCLACQAFIEADAVDAGSIEIDKGLEWLLDKQLSDEPGDWREPCPDLQGGGWAFQYSNYYYPDLDDTSMVAWAMRRTGKELYTEAIQRAAEWVAGMQSRGGGFGSFEVNNTQYYLNYIPFADHGALLDPPTADVTGRSIALLTLANKEKYTHNIAAGIAYLKKEQEEDGSWFGRWGTNYIYGTWSVLTALEVAEDDLQQDYIRHAVSWLRDTQNEDGGWGESNDSYFPPKHRRLHRSTPFQTAWALLALLAAGDARSETVKHGIEYLLANQCSNGVWEDEDFTAPGFPRVFYLKYHGYTKYFPFWALARYRNLITQSD
jgi:squalene-hopene/tetraprenyl-beta-curcumene cyclase